MGNKKRSSYDVGYKRPPKETRFQAGVSGNPSGRPKGSRNPRERLLAIGNQIITVTINGKPTRISKLDAIYRRLYNSALEGDPKSTRLLLSQVGGGSVRVAELEKALKEAEQPIILRVTPEDMAL